MSRFGEVDATSSYYTRSRIARNEFGPWGLANTGSLNYFRLLVMLRWQVSISTCCSIHPMCVHSWTRKPEYYAAADGWITTDTVVILSIYKKMQHQAWLWVFLSPAFSIIEKTRREIKRNTKKRELKRQEGETNLKFHVKNDTDTLNHFFLSSCYINKLSNEGSHISYTTISQIISTVYKLSVRNDKIQN